MQVKDVVHRHNLFAFEEYNVGDKVTFNVESQEGYSKQSLGIVNGFTVNNLGQLLVIVFDVYACIVRHMHPNNTSVNLKKFTA